MTLKSLEYLRENGWRHMNDVTGHVQEKLVIDYGKQDSLEICKHFEPKCKYFERKEGGE